MVGLMSHRRKLISAVSRMDYDSLGDEAGSARAMDVATFEDLIDRLGEDLSRWPDDWRLPAMQLLASSAEARALYEESSMVRRALAAPPVRAPAGLVDRIVFAAAKLPREPAAPEDQSKDAEAPAESVHPGKALPAL
ncbi:hypothetical protein [Bradyrhizobium genosp. P]|uniref:hypothetical protein n=1 Tax=Bradyrhizobium genosp. P TaxID=83641 RepID=UPI003CEF205B